MSDLRTRDADERADDGGPIVELRAASVDFVVGRRRLRRGGGPRLLHAVDCVDLTVESGGTFGLVGESGSGKTTVGRVVMGMLKPTSGQVVIAGRDLANLDRKELRQHQRTVQIVFQDPYSSLDPRMRVGRIIGEPLRTLADGPSGPVVLKRIHDLLELVGLPVSSAKKYPHQFSGGQRQRIAIARALASNPRLIVLDEPTSALDVSVRAQILNLLTDLQTELGLSYVFISHDLLTVAHMSSTVAVMYLGRIVEYGPTKQVYDSPRHPYTQLLLASILRDDEPPDVMLIKQDGEIPSALDMPKGCCFKSRCPLRRSLGSPVECDDISPPLRDVSSDHLSACHFVHELGRHNSGGP